MAGSSASSSSTGATTTTTAAGGTSSGPSSSSHGALFSLPPPVDFDAIRRKQRALTQAAGSAGSASSSQMNSPAAAAPPYHHHHHQQHGAGSSGNATSSANQANQFASMNQGNGINGQSSGSGNKYPMNSTPSSSHDPDAFQAALDQLMASNDHSMGTPTNNAASQPNVFAPSNQLHHHHQQHQQPHGGPPRQPSQPSTPQGSMFMPQHHQQQHGHLPHSHPHPPHHHHLHHLHSHAQGQPSGPSQFGPSPSPMSAEDHARLLSSASQSFNSFAMDLSRSQQAALNMQYVDPALASCISGVRNAAQTLCNDLAGISAALRASAMSSMWRGPGPRPSMGPNGAPNQWWPNDLSSVFAQMQGQQSGDSSTDSQPRSNGQRGNANDPNMLLNLFDQNQGLPPSLPPGPAEQMLDFLTHPSSGIAHDVNGGGGGGSSSAGPSNPKKRSADSSASPAAAGTSSSAAGPSASKMPKAAGKHKSRPPIEGVRRESVRYRNRKLLVDMREQLYKWLDTTEFCRIARSYPQGQNGWMTLPIDAERPELGTRRVFKPNFEIGADLYICNKELLETLIELGIQKVRDTPEAYGMKEGVEARDVVVDVAKDLMDSARHGYRANLKKQQEDEADAKAKSTRYKQQERHRTKVRNREVGAKRLRHPIPDALLTMGLHSDDAASDQDDMHKMDKDEWRRTRQRKLQSKRGWEALSPRWRNPHLTKAYHIADTLSKSKQMPRWRRDGGVDLDPPSRLWGKTLPKVVFDPTWLAENEARIKEVPFNITVEDRPVPGWKNEEHGLSDDTEDELERFEREVARVQRAARKKTAGTATTASSAAAAAYSMGMGGGVGGGGSGSRDSNAAGDRQHSASASSPASGRSEVQGGGGGRSRGRGRSDSGIGGGGEDGDADDEGQTHDDDGPMGMSMDVDYDGRPPSSMPDMLPKSGGMHNSFGGPGPGPNNSNSSAPVGPSMLHQTVDLV